MARSIMGLVGLGATLIFVLPVALLGVEFLLVRGRTTEGVGLLIVAGLMYGVKEYLTTPGDLTGMVADQTVGRVLEAPDDEE